MWTRRELKECAKQLLKINYWKAVLAGVILSLIGGSGVVSVVERSSSGSFDEVIGAVETDDFGLVLGIALGIVAVALLVNFIMTILIWNPLEVGCKKLPLISGNKNYSLPSALKKAGKTSTFSSPARKR